MLFVFLAGSCSCYAQSTDSIVQAAQTKYQSIRSHLKNYDTITREGWDESTEGQQITGYYKMKDMKVIETFSYYEMGKYELQLYFDNGLLFFAQENRHIYNRPIYWDKIHMLKNKELQLMTRRRQLSGVRNIISMTGYSFGGSILMKKKLIYHWEKIYTLENTSSHMHVSSGINWKNKGFSNLLSLTLNT